MWRLTVKCKEAESNSPIHPKTFSFVTRSHIKSGGKRKSDPEPRVSSPTPTTVGLWCPTEYVIWCIFPLKIRSLLGFRLLNISLFLMGQQVHRNELNFNPWYITLSPLIHSRFPFLFSLLINAQLKVLYPIWYPTEAINPSSWFPSILPAPCPHPSKHF